MSEQKTRDVYVGNGQTITVTPSDKTCYFLDIEKLGKHFDEHPDTPITVGATDDWFFTAREIKNKAMFDAIKNCHEYILLSSSWARFSDGNGNDYTVEIPADHAELAWRLGRSMEHGTIAFWVKGINQRIATLKYPAIQDFANRVDDLLKTYERESQ